MTASDMSPVIYSLIQSADTRGLCLTHVYAHKHASPSAVAGTCSASRGTQYKYHPLSLAEHAKEKGAEHRLSPCLINSPVSFNFDPPLEAGQKNNLPGQRQAEAIGWREMRAGGQRRRERECKGDEESERAFM